MSDGIGVVAGRVPNRGADSEKSTQYSVLGTRYETSPDCNQRPSSSVTPTLLRGLALTLALCSGCAGYQLGQRSLYRPDIRTVHVPIAQSDSFRRYLGEQLTEAVVKQIELRTPYKVVDEAAADSVLNLRLISEGKRIITNNRFSEPRDIETDFFLQVNWVDRRGDLIMTPAGIPAAPLLLNIGQQANFVPEGGQSLATAQQEAIFRLAEQVVGQMELAW